MQHIDINGFRCWSDYREHRAGAPTVVFLNGIMSQLESWDPQVELLARLGYNSLRYEYRGQWRSEHTPGELTLADHARDLAALLAHYGIERAHLVGTSYGGFVGMRYAGDFPGQPLSLLVIASSARIRPLPYTIVSHWRELAATGDAHGLFRSMLPDLYAERVFARNPELASKRGAEFEASADDFPDLLPGQVALHDASFRELLGDGLTEHLARIQCPTHVVAAEHDRLYPPADSAHIARHVHRAQLTIIGGVGHALLYERPRAVNTLLAGHLLTT